MWKLNFIIVLQKLPTKNMLCLFLNKILLQITKYEVNIYEYMIRLTPMTYAELHVLCIPMPCDMCSALYNIKK